MEVPNLAQMAEGYYNLMKKGVGVANEEVEQLAALRMDQCNTCENNGRPTLVGGKCTLCGCLMSAKTRSLNAKCPLKKW